ncbi:MAG: universal stress protein [Deltaproteobacteria bacterium]|nr:universal stress protein [Deltaproteobacteria bacterium]
MYKRILLPVDGSRLSEGILPYARSLARTLDIPVELFYVIDPETIMPSLVAKYGRYDNVLTAEREDRRDYLRKLATSFLASVAVDCSVDVGKPAEAIIDKAGASSDTVIAMATHGHSGINRWLLGSVAGKVLHAAANDMLLVRPTEETRNAEAALPNRILVPLDGSRLAESAIPHAVELARKLNVELALVRVYGLPTPGYPEGYVPDLGPLWEQVRKESQDYLEEKAGQLRKEGLERVSSVVLEGNAAEKIIDLAEERPQNLIVMCTHGRTGVVRWLLGSVTDRVVRHSATPILVIRATTK